MEELAANGKSLEAHCNQAVDMRRVFCSECVFELVHITADEEEEKTVGRK